MATASQLPPPRAVFYDANGNPLAAGYVWTYVPNTTTPKTTWQDAAEGTPNENPIPLDSAGSCLLYGSGDYQLTVLDSAGNQVPGYSGVCTAPLTVDGGTIASPLTIPATSANAYLKVSSVGGSGRIWDVVSFTTGDFVIYDETGGTNRLTIGSTGATNLYGSLTLNGAYDLNIGGTAAPGAGTAGVIAGHVGTINWGASGSINLSVLQKDSTSGAYFAFTYGAFSGSGGASVGAITTNGTTTAYGTTSDATLKLDDGLIGDEAGGIIDRLRPRWFRWKSAPGADSEPGFFAQQVHRVFPWAVTRGRGRKGRAGYQPWQMDAAKMMPVVVAELQALRRRVAALERR